MTTAERTSARPPRWGEVIDGERVYPLHLGQADLLRSKSRFRAAIAGTGGGKTAIGPLFVMTELERLLQEDAAGKRDLTADPVMGMVVAPTHPIKSRATAPTLVSMLQGTCWEGQYVPSALRYELPGVLCRRGWTRSAGTIWVLSADNPDGLEGGQFDFVWGDEAGQFKYGAMVAIEGRTGLKQSPVMLTTTPYGMNWLKYKFFDRAQKGDKNYYVRRWRSIDNPAYPREEYERAEGSMSPARFKQRYDAQFERCTGLVYPDLATCFMPHADVMRAVESKEGRGFGGMDWGWNDPFAALAAHVTPDKHVYLWFERYRRRVPVEEHAERLPRDVLWWADPSQPSMMRTMHVNGHAVRKAKNDIIEGIDAANELIYSGRLHVSDGCTALRAESEEYRYPEKDDEAVGDKPVDEFNHALDAFRYLAIGLKRLAAA